jgi:uncharacterized protein YbaA (DUF1428 family)
MALNNHLQYASGFRNRQTTLGVQNMSYIDGYVIPVPSNGKQAYLDMAKFTGAIFIEHGAIRVMECWGDDIPAGKTTDFKRAVKLEADETVVYSWIEWPSKRAREEGMKKFMQDARMLEDTRPMPFSGKRMIMGGFEGLLDIKA